VASDTSAGILTAEAELGQNFLRLQTQPPGRAGQVALSEGWANILLLSKAQALVATSRSSYALLAAGLRYVCVCVCVYIYIYIVANETYYGVKRDLSVSKEKRPSIRFLANVDPVCVCSGSSGDSRPFYGVKRDLSVSKET
jgi:hypothetical protein